jgi:hypothetical protein
MGLLRVASIYFLIALPMLAAENLTCKFNIDSLKRNENGYHYAYEGAENLIVNRNFSLPLKTIYIEANDRLKYSDFAISDRMTLGQMPVELTDFDNATTGDKQIDVESPLRKKEALYFPIYSIEKLTGNAGHIYAVSILPVSLDAAGNLYFNGSVSIEASVSLVSAYDRYLYSAKDIHSNFAQSRALSDSELATGVPLNCELLVITAPYMAAAFSEFIQFKRIIGYSVGIALTDSIFAHYPGIDGAEKIRNYLKDFYAMGGKYLLIGGDNQIVPARYLFYYNVGSSVRDTGDLMPSDLYYADLDGDWDSDGDGVWGEPSHDSPDLIPELRVGRLPIHSAEAAARYGRKLIAYYVNPGNGDYGYLTGILFFAADEMRDYPAEGQHHAIAEAYPRNFFSDTFYTVETPSGDSPQPTNYTGFQSIQKISEGYGIINFVTHGRVDGCLIRSANYGDWPASYIITSPASSGHGYTGNLARNNKTSFYYSLSCNVGGYDLDKIDGVDGDKSFAEQLIGLDSAGAIGMVANSRWGWVYSSYLLQKSFMERLFSEANRSPVDAMYLSWMDYPYYRDLIYGQNYYGDPTLKIYEEVPDKMTLSLQAKGINKYAVAARRGTEPVAGARVVFSKGGTIRKSGRTDADGSWEFSENLTLGSVYNITAIKDGFTVARIEYIPTIATGVDGDETQKPDEFALSQNYPNPFNPATIIHYSISYRSDVALEIFDVLGRKVFEKSLFDQPAGNYSLEWNGLNQLGGEAASGIYFYRLTAGNYSETKKMVLLK